VVEAVTQPTGFSPGLAARLRLSDGRRLFLKAVSASANPDTPDIHRREARILAAMPPTAPIARLLWSYDDQGWVALCLEDVDGRHPYEPWTEADLGLVVAALAKMAADLTPSPIAVDQTAAGAFATNINGWRLALERDEKQLDQWCLRNLERLAQLEAQAPKAAEGDTLLNFDVRADNMLIAGDRLYVLDWPWARTGAWWIDLLLMAPSVAMQGGPAPEDFLGRLGLRGVARGSIDAVICAMTGYFVVRALDPPPSGIPTVRAFQAAQGRVSIRWLHERTGWD
jgi:aminoglycoside phosphotransferase (APT) family kinase protein